MKILKWKFYISIITIVCLIAVIGVLVFMFTFSPVSPIYQKILISQAERKMQKIVSNLDNELVDYYTRYEDTLIPNEVGNYEEVRGYGLNLLLLNTQNNKSYIDEYLTIMLENQQGKFLKMNADGTSFKDRVGAPFELTLAMAVNEAGYYDSSSGIPVSFLPYTSKGVVWKEAAYGYPAEAMTLHQLNSSMSSVPLTSSLNDGKYKNLFQIDGSYFRDGSFTSSVIGYGMSSGRYYPDYVFLPDSLNYINQQFSNIITIYNIPDDDERLLRAMYSISHNGGPGSMSYYSTYGVRTEGRLTGAAHKRSDYEDRIKSVYNRFTSYFDSKDTYGQYKSSGKGYGQAFWVYYDQGFYIDNTLAKRVKVKGSYTQNQILGAYSSIYGKKLDPDEFIKMVNERTKEPWETGYVNFSTYDKVYGDIRGSDVFDKGNFWKFSEETSESYKHKVNGSSPKVLERMNYEVAGYVWDGIYAGKYIYAELLMKSGVDVDPTDRDSYYIPYSDEYLPTSPSFKSVMDKLGIKFDDPRVGEMIELGYEMSGGWYFLGGAGTVVNQENYQFFKGRKNWGDRNPEAFRLTYETIDGTDPSVLYNRRDENLINFGTYSFDCTALIYTIYNAVMGPLGFKEHEMTTSSYAALDGPVHVVNVKDRKAGDVYSGGGHAFMYIADNTTSSSQTLTKEESKTEITMVVRPGGIWVLEAAQTGKRVGIRMRGKPFESGKKLYRFDPFK